jgi:hypothetical protein
LKTFTLAHLKSVIGEYRRLIDRAMLPRVLLEGAAFQEATVHPEGVRVCLSVRRGGGSSARGGAAGAGGEGQWLEAALGHDCSAQEAVLTIYISFTN